MSLLSKTKSIEVARSHSVTMPDPEILELAIAYAKHEITEKQAAGAMGLNTNKAQGKMRHAIQSAIRTGQLVQK